jgi:tetratricopeptide (TPR) repeat protein/CHAT domain-containing protein
MRSRKGVSQWWVILAVVVMFIGSPAVCVSASVAKQEAAQADVPELVVGTPQERELKGGERHVYRLVLAADQYLRLVVEQHGIDVVVRLFGPDGRQLVEMDSPTGTQGAETVSFIADVGGTYRVEIAPLEREAAPGRYIVRIEELRPATERDRTRIAAERAFAEANLLAAQQKEDSFRQAAAKYEEAARLYHTLGERAKEAVCLLGAGAFSHHLGDLRKALEYYGQALPIFQALGNRAMEATILTLIGRVQDALGEKQKALEYYTQALTLHRAVGNRAGEATTLGNIGGVYYGLGEMQKALEYYTQALTLRRAIGDQKGEGETLASIGVVYDALGEKQKALEYHTQALAIFRAVGDRAGEATTLNNIGNVYSDLGEKQKALEYYTQALALHRAVGDRAGESVTLSNMGQVYSDLGEKQKALDYFTQSLALARAVGDRAGEATTLNNIGNVYSDLGEKQKALEYYTQALTLHRAVGDRAGEATTLSNIGGVYAGLGEKQKALEHLTQALTLHRAVGNREGEAATLTNIGGIYNTLGEKQKALEHFAQALAIFRAVGSRASEATTLNNIGGVYDTLGEKRKALEYYTQALALHRAVGNREGEATTLSNIGAVYYGLGERQKALEYLTQALAIFRAVGDRASEATLLNNIGQVYSALGEKQKALEYYTQALALRRAVGDRAGEATTLNNIGLVYSDLGEKQKALEYYTQALAIFRAVGDRASEATLLNNIGQVYSALGEKQKALEYYTQALALRRAVGDRAGEATTLNDIGGVYYGLGERQKALEYLTQALAIFRAVGDRASEATLLNNIGQVYSALGEKQKALEYYTQALALHRAVGNRAGEATTLNNIGKVHDDLGEKQKALEYYTQALDIVRAVGFREGEAMTLGNIGVIERDRGNLGEARTRIEAALDLIEAVRAQAPGPELRATFLASYRGFYELYIDLLLRQHEREPDKGHDRVAFQASERARARSLLELLAEARVDVRQGIAPELKERERAVHARLAAIQSRLLQAYRQLHPDAAQIAALEAEFKQADAEREEVEWEIRRRHPRYAELQYPTPVGVSAVQGMLEEGTALLEYVLLRENGVVFVVTREEFRAVRLGSAQTIREYVEKLREAVAAGPRRGAFSNYVLHARWLYQELVQPVEAWIEGKRELIIVPDGILYYLPFELLLTSAEGMGGDPRRLPYLVRKYAVRYVPSASVWVGLGRPEAERREWEKTLVAYADPVYGDMEGAVREAWRSAFGELAKLPRLPHSRREVQQIARLYPAADVVLRVGQEAREERVKSGEAERARYVHFAAHGVLNENKPEYSGIVLTLGAPSALATRAGETARRAEPERAGQREESAEDGLLQVYEVFNLRLNAEVAVLSACETGLGKEVRGEGIVGLTRAFLYAGAEAVVVSLWKVMDPATAELMVRFYRHLRAGMKKAEALRQARLEMLDQYVHPYYWAAFVLVGKS